MQLRHDVGHMLLGVLEKKGVKDPTRCGACGLPGRMSLHDTFLAMSENPALQQADMSIKGQCDYYVLTCQNCGNVELFDRLTLGYPPKSPE